MPRRFASSINLTAFALIGAMLDPVSSDPSGLGTGDKGRTWFNVTTGKLMVWNGTAAIDLLARANHTGTQLAATISDLASTVQAYRLDQFAAPTGSVALGGQKITGLADGVAGSDAASYGQVLALINNQVFKAAARVASTANLTLSAPQTIDGVSVVAGDRVLVKDQTTGANNGIYVVAAGAWTRATDADASMELPPGAIIPIAEGAANGDKLFMLTTNGPITLGTTSLTFLAYGASSGEIGVAGAGLTKTGVTYDVVGGTGITVGADLVSIDTAVVVRKVGGAVPATTTGIFTVSGANVTVNHTLANSAPDVVVTAGVTPVSGYTAGQVVETDWVVADANNITITFPATPVAGNWIVGVTG